MSETDDIRDDVFHAGSSRIVKKEYEQRLVARRIAEDDAFTSHQAVNLPTIKAEPNNPFLDNRAQQAVFTASIPAPPTINGQDSPFSMMVGSNPNIIQRDYNQHVMDDRRVVWVTKWVDYSNR